MSEPEPEAPNTKNKSKHDKRTSGGVKLADDSGLLSVGQDCLRRRLSVPSLMAETPGLDTTKRKTSSRINLGENLFMD